MKWILLCCFLTLPFLHAKAQPGWSEGYIITNAGDTLHGKIRYLTPAERAARILFKEEGYHDRIRYRPFSIRGYYVEGQHYISRMYDVKPSPSYGLGVFMRVRTVGESPVQILDYRNTDDDRGYTETFLVKNGGKAYRVNPMRFKRDAARYFRDYKELQEDILQGKYSRRQLADIVKRYNQWTGG